jgi:hypothetical protein
MNFTVGMGRNLRADEAVDHARVAEECGGIPQSLQSFPQGKEEG